MSIVFLDTEATGIRGDDEIWEVAARRRNDDGTAEDLHLFVEHDERKAQDLPTSFFQDWAARFDRRKALPRARVAARIQEFTCGHHIVGAVPNFDTEKLAVLMRGAGLEPKWHYHLIDVENLVVGYLRGRLQHQKLTRPDEEALQKLVTPPWNSEDLSRAVGVSPTVFERHTAMGDVGWAEAMFDAVMGLNEK